VQLGLKEFGSALRDGLGMHALSSDDIAVIAGKGYTLTLSLSLSRARSLSSPLSL
jgi:hypothetical protein